MKRIHSIDFARGLVMIIMALDHTRDFLHTDALTQDPTNLATTTPILFFTRWITHFCAPSFVFLSGGSAYLSLKKRPDPRENRLFLLKRGIWLVVLEFTLVNFLLWYDIHFRTLIFEVIATIGCGFIILSFLYKLSAKILVILGLILVFAHDATSTILVKNPVLNFMGALFLGRAAFPITPNLLLIIGYPILPWLGIMLTGFGCGRLFELPAAERKKHFLRTGGAAICLFILLRATNLYGNPTPWTVQKNEVFTFLSFINYSKYPPSLCFTLATVGGLFLLLAISEGWDNKVTKRVSVYGKTPLFYFLLHLGVIHALLFVMVFMQGYPISDLVFGTAKIGRPASGSGISLPWVYVVWLGVVAIMYPLCGWYGRYKMSHPEKTWLRYL